jgi:hypothetical protein
MQPRVLQSLRHPRVRELLAALVVAALFLGALLPAGYMPSGAGGQGWLKLCNGKSVPSTPGHDGIEPCSFAAGVAAFAPPPPPPALVIADIFSNLPILSAQASSRSPAGTPRAQSPRAPPAG